MFICVPIKVLHEAAGHTMTCEASTGEVHREKLSGGEDNVNCQMSDMTEISGGAWVAQLVECLISAQVMISDSWVGAPCRALC
uniref:Uncharacterized protein n=1 Tax=Suricata suricatta TaxID=37032 RepID=A0A673SZ13_SURSU